VPLFSQIHSPFDPFVLRNCHCVFRDNVGGARLLGEVLVAVASVQLAAREWDG
jgi:hypothetical protein